MWCLDQYIRYVEAKEPDDAIKLPQILEVVKIVREGRSIITGNPVEHPRNNLVRFLNLRIQRVRPQFPMIWATDHPFKSGAPNLWAIPWDQHLENERIRGIRLESRNQAKFWGEARALMEHAPESLADFDRIQSMLLNARACAERVEEMREQISDTVRIG